MKKIDSFAFQCHQAIIESFNIVTIDPSLYHVAIFVRSSSNKLHFCRLDRKEADDNRDRRDGNEQTFN